VWERMRAIDVAFTSTGTFPGVVYLTPSPADEVRLLTQLVVRTWPDLLPYEGVHGDDIPHLTVAYADDPRLARRIADELEARLPISARLTVASIFVFDGTTWRERFSLPLGQ
ncbi:MAG TPA: 2'-5' RNA ligase family protein, partial [Actinomycetota bacterium]|nr:2'-5' RNA ligase family protein [Actinomycetota bacterium]